MQALVRNPAGRDPIFTAFDALMRDMLAPCAAVTEPAVIKPRVDVFDRGGAFELVADLPGVAKADIKIEIEGDRVAITAAAAPDRACKDGERLVFGERAARRYARSFTLPTEIDAAAAQARYEDGVLSLTLPKRAVAAPRAIVVQ